MRNVRELVTLLRGRLITRDFRVWPALFAILAPGLSEVSAVAYDFGFQTNPFVYEDSYSGGGNGAAPIISLDMDAKDALNSSFRIAAREERVDDLARALRGGADVNSRSDAGVTALMYASRLCSRPVIDLLLRARADVNSLDADGRTALMYAVKESCQDAVELMLKIPGTRWDLRDHSGLSALDYARDMASVDVDGPAVEILSRLRRADRLTHLTASAVTPRSLPPALTASPDERRSLPDKH